MASEDGEQQREAMRRIAEARVKTGDFIARLMMAYAGFAAFCFFALFSPDRLMIDAQASLDMPLAGTVSFLAFMVVAPVVLIGLRVYLEVYVQHWRQLDAQLGPKTEPRTLSPLKHPLLRRFFYLEFYFLLTAMLLLFTWKAAAKERAAVSALGDALGSTSNGALKVARYGLRSIRCLAITWMTRPSRCRRPSMPSRRALSSTLRWRA